MNKLKIDIDENIDFSNPETITREAIIDYYEKIHIKYGDFCGDCKHLNVEEMCDKRNRVRKYNLDIGPFDYVILKKQCKEFELFNPEVEEDKIKETVSLMLNCFMQQYC